jgi:degT/dnrJ/eryC1/strS aminotransferase
VKLSSFTASFHEYEYSLEYYHGKDVLHEGSLLKIDPSYSWERINRKIRNKIRQAQKQDIGIRRVTGTAKDIANFRTIWFDPDDETLPVQLSDDEVMYLAYANGELIGGLILTPSTPNTLYMHNLGGNEFAKRHNVPALLLWHAVEDLVGTRWQYIDVGVSFRPTLYNFFKNWKVDSYPIIFSPPFIRPDIRLTPFTGRDIVRFNNDTPKQADEIIAQYFGDTYTILPRAISCLQVVLKYLGIGKSDSVAVYKTFAGNEYISGCVRTPIKQHGTMVREIDDSTKAVVVIHEFGIPYENLRELKKRCEEKNIPLIEDCAWSYGSELADGTRIGSVGDYAIYSLPKILPVQYGSVLVGLQVSDEDNWQNYQLLDFYKREIVQKALVEHLPRLESYNLQRRKNWQTLSEWFVRDGFTEIGTLGKKVYPGAYIVKVPEYEDIFSRYEMFGVETGRYYPDEALFLPVHQSLAQNELAYMYGVFRGKLNLCSNYQRGGKK